MTPDELLARAPLLLPRRLGPVPRRRRQRTALRPLKEPRAEMLRYAAVLRALVAETVALVRAELVPRLPSLVAEAGGAPVRTDAAGDRLADILSSVRMALGLSEGRARRWAVEMLERLQRKNARDFVTVYEGSLAVSPLVGAEPWLKEQMSIALKENVRLIQSLPEQMLGQVEGIVQRGILAGKRHEELATQIAERFGVADTRARLIARDQTLKFHGSLTRLRQMDAGVTEYTWSTSRDERVRPSHRARDGKRYKWTDSPKPGEEVNCRCAAIPVIPEVDQETPAWIEGPAQSATTAKRSRKRLWQW